MIKYLCKVCLIDRHNRKRNIYKKTSHPKHDRTAAYCIHLRHSSDYCLPSTPNVKLGSRPNFLHGLGCGPHWLWSVVYLDGSLIAQNRIHGLLSIFIRPVFIHHLLLHYAGTIMQYPTLPRRWGTLLENVGIDCVKSPRDSTRPPRSKAAVSRHSYPSRVSYLPRNGFIEDCKTIDHKSILVFKGVRYQHPFAQGWPKRHYGCR
jgi:hypothetical protein